MNRSRALGIVFVVTGMVALASCSKKQAPASDEPAAEHEPAARDTLRLSDESLQLITLDTIVVTHGTLDLALPAPGHVSFNLNRSAQVSPTLEGRIVSMNFDVGATVRAGDVMVVIDSPEMLTQALELKAPASGEVTGRHGTVGEIVDKSRELYTISDPASVWVIADVSANDVASVRVGQSVTLHTTGNPDDVSTGKVVLVSPEVAEQSRTVEVRIEPDRPDARLRPGMFVDVEIVTGSLPHVVVIPETAIQRMDDQDMVFVASDAHTFVKRIVTTSNNRDGRVQILDGLRDGERVVTRGSFLLKSELMKTEFGE